MNAVQANLEDARWAARLPSAVRVRGWAFFSDGRRGRRVVARIAGRTVAATATAGRPDVAAAFPDRPGAADAGFAFEAPHHRLDEPVELLLEDEDGGLETFARLAAADLPDRGPLLPADGGWHRHLPEPAGAAPAGEPLFSLLLPVHNPPPRVLGECLASVLAQEHRRWELCVVDDASTDPEVVRRLDALARADPRVRLHRRPRNGGIARATNEALARATGDFVAFVDHDDLLHPRALAAYAARLRREPLDALYSDEEVVSEDGRPLVPFLKPAWSPEFLRGVMYVGHLLAVRTALAREVGGLDPAFDGVQDFEFMLRVGERTARIGHVAAVLYRWRQSERSSARHGNVKGDMDARQRDAVEAHLRRTGDGRRAVALGGHRLRLEAPLAGRPSAATVPRTADLVAALVRTAQETTAELLVVGAGGDEALAPDLAALAALPDTGCAAPVLLRSDGATVLAAGWTWRDGRTAPLMEEFGADGDGYHGSLRCNREVAHLAPWHAVLRRDLVLAHAPGAGSWTDFLARLRAAGLFLRVCASVRVRAPESVGAEEADRPAVADAGDPWYPSAFARHGGGYSLPD